VTITVVGAILIVAAILLVFLLFGRRR